MLRASCMLRLCESDYTTATDGGCSRERNVPLFHSLVFRYSPQSSIMLLQCQRHARRANGKHCRQDCLGLRRLVGSRRTSVLLTAKMRPEARQTSPGSRLDSRFLPGFARMTEDDREKARLLDREPLRGKGPVDHRCYSGGGKHWYTSKNRTHDGRKLTLSPTVPRFTVPRDGFEPSTP